MKRWAAVARLGGVGDNLIAASVLRPLKRQGYMTEIITSEMAHEVFFNNPFLDRLTIKKDGDIPGGAEWQKWFTARAKEYDVFVHLSHSMEMRHALFPDQSAFWWPQDYRREICAGSYMETAHKIAGLTPPFDFGPMFFPTEQERERADQIKQELGGRFCAWILSGSRLDKTYPYSPQAIARIIKELDIPVAMFGIGGKQYQDAVTVMQEVGRQNGVRGQLFEKYQSNMGPDGRHMADHLFLALSPATADPGGHQSWGLRRSLSQILAADLVIAPDTGAAWACAFEPMPKIVLVSHASVENITAGWKNTLTLHADPQRVDCWPCHRLHSDPSTCRPAKDMGASAACMADISVETIIETAARLLRKDNVIALHDEAAA